MVVNRGYNRSVIEKSAERALFHPDDTLSLLEHKLEKFRAEIEVTKSLIEILNAIFHAPIKSYD